jgi:hypothetical protein
VAGAILGLAYSVFMTPKYTAVYTFVLDDADKDGMLSQYAGLASLAGIDISNTGGSIFKGDNILELYKSRLMIKKTLLDEMVSGGKKQKLIDRYIDFNHFRTSWLKKKDFEGVYFHGDPAKFNRKQDSIITRFAEIFNEKNLDVSKPDKKMSVINVSFTSPDELFAKEFTDRLVQNVNDFYVQTKTKKTLQNVKVLQQQADSVRQVLNASIRGVASATEAAPLANPILATLKSPSQRRQVDVQTSSAVYAETVKSLEMAKVSLRQQTPLIQYIDQPVYPLKNNRIKKIPGMIAGGFLGFFLIFFIFLLRRLSRSLSETVN